MSIGSPRSLPHVPAVGALGVALDADGFAPHELAVRRLVRTAWARGVSRTATDVLADTTAPDVARLRAFAVVSAALSSGANDGDPGRVRPVA
jgi:hypothetical protein